MEVRKNFVNFNRQLNREQLIESRLLSRRDRFNSTRGIFDVPEPEIDCTVTSREVMLQRWKAQRELKKKEQKLKKPAFVVGAISKIPSTIPLKVNRDLNLQKSSFNKIKLPAKKCGINEDDPRLLSHKTIPKVTTSTLPKPLLPSKKCENILIPKALPKSNIPSMKTSVLNPTLKPFKPDCKVNCTGIPKANFCKAVPKLFLFGNKSKEKRTIKNKKETNATVPIKKESLSSCNISQILPKVDDQNIQNSDDALTTLNPKNKLRTSTPLKPADVNLQKSPKNEKPDTLALEEVSSTIRHLSISEENSTVSAKSDFKTTEISSDGSKNTLQSSLITHSHNDEFKKLKVDVKDPESCKTEKTQIDKLFKKSEKRDSCEDLRHMPRPSVMGFDTDESLDSPCAAAANISYDFDNLDNEDHVFAKKNDQNGKKVKNDQNGKKVSLLYNPNRRQTRLTSIKGDLMTFSSPE